MDCIFKIKIYLIMLINNKKIKEKNEFGIKVLHRLWECYGRPRKTAKTKSATMADVRKNTFRRCAADGLSARLRRLLHRAVHFLAEQVGWSGLPTPRQRVPLPDLWSAGTPELLRRAATFA